jgi:NADP-dependent 3-hydroxy acid dehydrogenase YdfG
LLFSARPTSAVWERQAAQRCQAEGAKLVLAARRLDRVQAIADSLGALAIGCDITDEQQLADLADAAVSHYGKLDGAINFAGIETSFTDRLISAARCCRKTAMYT